MVNKLGGPDEGQELETGIEKPKSGVASSVNDLVGPSQSLEGIMKKLGLNLFEADDGGYPMYIASKDTYREKILPQFGRDTLPEEGKVIFVTEPLHSESVTIAITSQKWSDNHIETMGTYDNHHYFNKQNPNGFFPRDMEEE